MRPPLGLAFAPQLERLTDEDHPRRVRDQARREVIQALRDQGLELAEAGGVFSVGRWEPAGGGQETFEPLWEIHPSGVLVPWDGWPAPEEMGEDRVNERRDRVADRVQACLVEGRPDHALASLAQELARDTELELAPWEEEQAVLEPFLSTLGDRGAQAMAACLAALAPEDRLAETITGQLADWAADHPDWVPPEPLDGFWLVARHWDADRPWEGSFELAGRAGDRIGGRALGLATDKHATFGDVNWGTAVLREWGTRQALESLWTTLETWHQRGRYELADLTAIKILEVLETLEAGPEELAAAARRLDPVVQDGVAKGVSMHETLDAIEALEAAARGDPLGTELAERGIDRDRLYFAVVRRVLDDRPATVDLRTGEIHRPLDKWLQLDQEEPDDGKDPEPEIPEAHRWDLEPLTSEAYTAKLEAIAEGLPEPLAREVEDRIGHVGQLSLVPDALLGHPEAWRRYHRELHAWEEDHVERVGRELIEAIDRHHGQAAGPADEDAAPVPGPHPGDR